MKDTHNNSPLEYLNGEKLFGYGGIELGNCYYSYGMPLLYQTNLSNKGRIIFKSKIISSLHQDQCYFVLYNDNTTIKLKFTAFEMLALEVNGVSKSIFSSSNFFTKPHQIDFQYSLNNGNLTYTFNFGNNHIVNGNISFTESSSTGASDFKLLIGSDNVRKTIKDLDNNNFSIKKEFFNGFISDLIYFSTYNNSIAYNELEELKTPVISYTSSDIFERKNESKIYYKNKNVISKKFDYLKNDKYITPFLKEEKILLNSSTNNFSGTLNRRYLYSYEGAYENAPKYKNIYGYEEDTTVSGENVAQVYKREYEYTEGSNFIKKEIIKKGSISNGEFIQSNKWQVDYTYNNNNCLTSVKTTYNDSSITTNSFTYSSSFPHLLTYNNSNSFVYDGLYLKQIKNYMGQVIKQFNYRGTKITSIKEPLQNKSVLFDYDYQGRRIKKLNQTINDLVEYYYDENMLIKEKHSNYSLNFLYNENNELIGFEHISSNNSAKTKYFYLRNAFNDIVEILDGNGNSLVHYLYDAFGNTIEIIDNSSISLGVINPFRYRGYYYDVETQLYWVSSRYYSPELCRWILPDSIEYLDPQSINGLNLYAYCKNDPINKYDPTGHFAITLTTLLISGLIAGAIGAGIGLGTAIYKDVKEDGVRFNGDWTDYVGRILGGFVAGFGVGICTALGAGVGVAALGETTATLFTSNGLTLSLGSALGIGGGVAFATGMAGYAVRTGISKSEDFKVENMFIEGGFNAASGVLSVLGGYLGGITGVHNTVFTKLLSKKGDFWLRLLVENVFTAGFKLTNALIKSYFMI